jgi:hypothetical protein
MAVRGGTIMARSEPIVYEGEAVPQREKLELGRRLPRAGDGRRRARVRVDKLRGYCVI